MYSDAMTKDETICKRCGKSIPQQTGRGRPRLYCPEGDCAQQAKKVRALRRSTPGLEGALARAEDLYEQLDASLSAAITPLAEALRYELDPAGIESKIADIKAEAHAQVQQARHERDQAVADRQERDQVNAQLTAELEQLRENLRDAQAAIKEADTKAAESAEHAQTAYADAEQARSARQEAFSEAEHAKDAEQEALSQAAQARDDRQRALDSAHEAQSVASQAREAEASAVERAEEAQLVSSRLERERDRAQELSSEAQGQLQRALQAQAVAQSHAQRDRELLEFAQEDRLQAMANRDRALQDVAVLQARLETSESSRGSDEELIERLRVEVGEWTQRCVAAEARLEGSSPGPGSEDS